MNLCYNGYKRIVKTALATVVLTVGLTTTSMAQLGDASAILRASAEDANTLMEAYLKPFGSGFGAALNNGWTNTAKPHKKLGFDVTVGISTALVPTSGESFDVNELNFNTLELKSGDPMTPTVSGSKETSAVLRATTDIDLPGGGTETVELFNFNMPGGVGQPYVPAPVVKLGVGLIADTELMVRYMPTYKVPIVNADINLWGVGVKHNIKQWIPGGKMIPVDISVMGGYTDFSLNKNFDVTPDDVITDPNDTVNPYSAGSSEWDGQGIELGTTAYNVNVLVGKTLPIVSVYGGIGIESSTTTIGTPGSYPIIEPNPNFDGSNEKFQVNQVDEPIDIELKGDNSFRAMVGARVRILVFTVSASYTHSKYPSATVGVGVGIR
ncbi:MAG: DUF6588 family protein [Bacteroidota bacterium]